MSEAAAPLTSSPSEAERRAGFLSAASAYIIWGFLPLYLKLLHAVDVREVLAQRILWAAPSALLAVFLMSGWRPGLREIATAFKPSMIATLAVSACFIFVNWGLYVYLVLNERVIESALAYFLAPLVAVAVGVLFFGEKIRTPQIVALALALVGVVVQGFALGAPPWMALALCATWSVYAVIRKRAPVPAAVGLLIESLALMPLVVGLLWWASSEAPLSFTSDWSMALLLAIAGPRNGDPAHGVCVRRAPRDLHHARSAPISRADAAILNRSCIWRIVHAAARGELCADLARFGLLRMGYFAPR
ncbi:MAG: EamA family transporter RarD [Caulobacteraceae bacterium]|nr:EamA family transporter RarD [Caulobacteraceae bacterium]